MLYCTYRWIVLLLLTLCSLPGIGAFGRTAVAEEAASEGSKYVVYYFYTRIRCEACLSVERLTKLSIEGNEKQPSPFSEKVKAGLLEFKAINIDEGGNKQRYEMLGYKEKVPLIVEYRNDRPVRNFSLGQAWFLYSNEGNFLAYAREALATFLDGKEPVTVDLGQYITARAAYERQQKEANFFIVDVRTPEEYVFIGHPTKAYNVPFSFMTYTIDPASKKQGMKKNPQFIELIKKRFKTDDHLAFLCRSGPRAAMAVTALQKAGYKNLYVIEHGFEGDAEGNPASPNFGKRTVAGWRNDQLPWTDALVPEYMYLENLAEAK